MALGALAWRLAVGRESARPRVDARAALLVGLCLAALGLRVFVLVQSGRLGADEAVEGLMARHILTSHELPVFYWGQAYFGALEAYLVAGLFGILGLHTWWLVFVPAVVASTALVPLTWALAEQLGPWPAGPLAALLAAAPTPVLSRMLTNAGGGFALGFALEFCALLCFLTKRLSLYALLGGLACWVWQPAVLGLAPLLGLALLRRQARSVAPVLVGLAPMLLYNATAGWPTPAWLLDKFGTQPGKAIAPLLLTAFGGGEETLGGANLAQGLLLAVAYATQAVLLVQTTPERRRTTLLVLLTIGLTVAAGHAGARHLIPATLAGCALSGALLARLRPRGGAGLLVGVAIAAANLVQYADVPATLQQERLSKLADTQAAIAALDDRGLTTGYADYWSAYPMMYLSEERIVVAPALGVDRYPAYTRRVESAAEPARLFAVLDPSCATQPSSAALAPARIEDVARWRLIWNITTPEGNDVLRAAVAAQGACA